MLSRAAFVGAAVVLASANSASAQTVTGFAVNRFEPAGADSAWMTADSLRFEGHLKPVFALVDDFAWKPLIVYDAQGHEIAPLVRDQMFAHLDAALLLWNRARVDLSLPVALVNGGRGTALGSATYQPPDGAALGTFGWVWTASSTSTLTGWSWRRSGCNCSCRRGAPPRSRATAACACGRACRSRASAVSSRGRRAWVQVRPSDGCHCDLAPGTEIVGALAGGWRPRPSGWSDPS